MALLGALSAVAPLVQAQWLEGMIAEIRAYSDASSSPLGSPMLAVYASLVPSAGCTNPAFMLIPSDPLYRETYAMLLAAKASGAKIKYLHVHCHGSGFARGNAYSIAQ